MHNLRLVYTGKTLTDLRVGDFCYNCSEQANSLWFACAILMNPRSVFENGHLTRVLERARFFLGSLHGTLGLVVKFSGSQVFSDNT